MFFVDCPVSNPKVIPNPMYLPSIRPLVRTEKQQQPSKTPNQPRPNKNAIAFVWERNVVDVVVCVILFHSLKTRVQSQISLLLLNSRRTEAREAAGEMKDLLSRRTSPAADPKQLPPCLFFPSLLSSSHLFQCHDHALPFQLEASHEVFPSYRGPAAEATASGAAEVNVPKRLHPR